MCFKENTDYYGKSGFTYASEFNRHYRIGFTAASAISFKLIGILASAGVSLSNLLLVYSRFYHHEYTQKAGINPAFCVFGGPYATQSYN